MNEMILLFFVSVLSTCYGFLLNGNTLPPPTTGSVLTDAHYDFVMQFVIQERQSRLQLQKEVKQLQQQLLVTETDLKNKIKAMDRCSSVDQNRNQIEDLNNKTRVLENNLNELTKNYDAIKLQNSQLLLQNKQMQNNSKRLEMEVSNLNKLQSVSDMRVIVNLQNQTNHLEQEIKETNSRQSVISSEANARKQDFIALFQKLQMTESELHLTVDRLDNKTSETDKNLNNTASLLARRLQNTVTATNNTLKKLESSFQTSITSVQQKLNETSNKGVILSACSNGGTYTHGQTIPFSSVKTSYGINNLSSYKSSGIFTCENEGYYLISFFITTQAASADMQLHLNGAYIVRATKHGVNDYQTNTAIVINHLKIGDKISIYAGSTFYVSSCNDSFFNIVQIL